MADNSPNPTPRPASLSAGALAGKTPFSWNGLVSGSALVFGALAAAWLFFFDVLRGEWDVNPQYSFGYVVPLLGAALFWRRWADRPATAPGSSPILGWVVAGLLFLQLPLSLVLVANPEWRLLYWINGIQVLGLTACWLFRWGGWAWVRHFGPPLVFTLIAVPWPMGWETSVIQGLMKLIASLTVEVAGLMSIPAVQHGNLIEVGVGIVGIDEACSGVRSLQSALMLSLFLGEMHRFSWPRRAALLGASLVFVLLANLTRTTFLVWAAANRGLHQMEAWHDTAGNVIMLIVLPSLIGLAHLMKPKTSPDILPAVAGKDVFVPVPRWIGLAALVWLAAVLVTTELWYRQHEARLIPSPRWSMAWPTQNPQFAKKAVPEKSLAILRCSNSESAAWQDDQGNQWSAFLLRWEPGKNSTQLAKGHRPDICFPATGARLAEDYGLVTLTANGVTMRFRHQSFARGADLLHVFYCLWSDQVSPDEGAVIEDGSVASRLASTLAGKRNLGQRVLEIVVQGPDSSAAATDLLKAQLPMLVNRD